MSVYQEKPWLKFYESHVPEFIDYPQTVLPDELVKIAAKYPDHPVMIFRGTTVSYREFDAAVDRCAAGLQKLGINKGDRVAVQLPNCPQFPIVYYAALRIGAIVVPCNFIYTAREMKHQLQDSGAEVIIIYSANYPVIKRIRNDTNLRHVIVTKIQAYFPPLTKLLFTLFREKKMGHRVSISGDENTHWFQDWMAQAPPKPQPVEVTWDDTAVLMYTGGTTGLSKGAQLTHKNVFVNAYQVTIWIGGEEAVDSTLSTIPLFHSYGMTLCMNTNIIGGNCMVLIVNPRDLDDILKSIDRHRPTYYPGVPAMYVAINNHPDVGKYDLSSIKSCSSGAAPLPMEVQQSFQSLTGAQLREGYGLSETSPVTHGNPAYGENRIGTIGVPWPDTECKIMDGDTGTREMGVGEVGEICIRGPQVMKGYWQMPTETANTLRDHGDGGDPWIHTGDLARMDEDGFFKIVDRKKDMILGAGGYNIYPREVEDVLYEHHKVKEAVAAGVPMEGKGERVKVYIVLKQGETSTEEEIRQFCKENLAPYKVPKFVEFRDALPMTATGKILRRELVAEEMKRQVKG